MSNATPMRYSPVAMTLHWLIATVILVNFGLALYFSRLRFGDDDSNQVAYLWHMSTGMCVLVLSVLRLIWRLLHRYPALPRDMGFAARVLAKGTHGLLYVFMLAAPLSGWVVTSLRRQTASMLGLFDWPVLPFINTATTHDQRVAIYQATLPSHLVMSYIGIALVAVHAAAALYHHFYRRDDVLRRMWPRRGGVATRPELNPGARSA